jgi:phosphoserine aminotransferase
MAKRNEKKGEILYGALDARPDFYRASVERESRSLMNVVWNLPTKELEAKFVAEASQKGMVGLKGHRITGGIRASLYNAVGEEAVRALVDFMDDFARRA